MTRTFDAKPGAREHVPLLIGLMGPSGGGKTYSALRLGAGIASISNGELYYIDTEARRALHYADQFGFRYVDFRAPFGSLDYLAAVQHCVSKGAGVVVVDSMSHEHEGPGGYLQTAETELERLSGGDPDKRERVRMLAWARPAKERRMMVNGLLQLNTNLIFCFRAKEKIKLAKIDGRTKPIEMGWMPIAGEALLYEMTLNCLLLPRANGMPTWKSENPGELQMMKLPKQFEKIFSESRQLTEDVGKQLAMWARGGNGVAKEEKPAAATNWLCPKGAEEPDSLLINASRIGLGALETAWKRLSEENRAMLKVRLDNVHKPNAKAGIGRE